MTPEQLFLASPFLAREAKRHPDLGSIRDNAAARTALKSEIQQLKDISPKLDPHQVGAKLRTAKSRTAFLLALGDRCYNWPHEWITEALSDIADLALAIALESLWEEAKHRNMVALDSDTKTSGLFILAMGKLGGRDLNYSSDIDVIYFYDPQTLPYTGPKSPRDFAERLARNLTELLDQRTAQGYVFRVDLRLRPDPSSTALMVPVNAAIEYYHMAAQNWERAAFIKARPAAGDREAAERFLSELAPWIWRRTVDFAALEDLADMKAKATAHAQQKQDQIEGFDIKLGVGGIREIEVFVQINQLLFGGRDSRIRGRSTLDVLDLLAAADRIDAKISTQLKAAYYFLRRLEHAVQMREDMQTHELPTTPDALEATASLMDCSISVLLDTLKRHRDAVSTAYGNLLPDDEPLSRVMPKWLNQSPGAQAIVEGWRDRPYQALRSDRAQRLISQCLPLLLEGIGKTASPDRALTRLDQFLAKLPSGVQLFSMLHNNPRLNDLLISILGAAPILADALAKRPTLWAPIVEAGFFDHLGDLQTMRADMTAFLGRAKDLQDILDLSRQYVHEQRFRLGVQYLEDVADLEEIELNLSNLAQLAFEAVAGAIEKSFIEKFGEFADGQLIVLALGRLGERSMTFTSDIDLIFLYDAPSPGTLSAKGMPASQYFSRLSQQILTAVTSQSPYGILYDVDTRLRPHGNQGPLVAHMATFNSYYQQDAWAWEYLALSKNRIIYPTETPDPALEASRHKALAGHKRLEDFASDVTAMRQKLLIESPAKSLWDLKRCPGGLMDIDFIIQYMWLTQAHESLPRPHMGVQAFVAQAKVAGLLSQDDAAHLRSAHKDLSKIFALYRLCMGQSPKAMADLPRAVTSRLCAAVQASDLAELESRVRTHTKLIQKIFNTVIGPCYEV